MDEQKEISKLIEENKDLRARLAKLENHAPTEIASMKLKNQALQTSEEKYRLLVEHLGVPVSVFNLKGELILLNESAAIRLGGGKKELLGKTFSQLLGTEIGEKAHKRLEEIVKTGQTQEHEDKIVIESESRWWWTIQTPVKDTDGKVVGVQVISHDITGKKEAETAIRDSEKKLKLAQRFAKMGSWERDFTSNITTCSDEMYSVYGYDTGGFEPSFEFFKSKVHPDDLGKFEIAVDKASTGAGLFECKFRIVRADGSIRHLHSRGDIYLDDNDNPVRSFGVTQDITEQTELEENLRKSEEQICAVFEATSDCILVWDKDYNYLYANQSAIDHVGTTRDKVIGKNIRDGLGHIPEFMKLWMDRVDSVFKTGESFEVEDAVPVGNTLAYSESVISPIKNISGEVAAATVVYRDVTNRKQAEEVIRKSEDKYRGLVNNIPDVTWTTDQNGVTTYISSNIESIYGFTAEEITSSDSSIWLDRVHPEDIGMLKKAVSKLFSSGEKCDLEYRIKHKDGHWIWIHDRSVTTYRKDGLVYSDGVFSDITKAKISEETLRKSEKRYRNLFEFASDALIICDSEGKILDVNHVACEMHGYVKKDFLELSCKDIVHPDYHEKCHRAFDAAKKGKTYSAEVEHICANGKTIPVEVRISPSQHEGQKAGLVSIRDITRRKEAERALQESQERYKLLSDVAVEGIVIHEESKVIEANKNFCEIFGYTLDELKSLDSLALIAPKHRALVREGMGKKHSGPYEVTGVKKDGKEFPITIQARSMEISGRPLRVGSIRDITAEKRMADELEDSREKIIQSQRHAYINSTGSIVAHQLNQPLTIINMLLGQIKDDIRKGRFGSPKAIDQIDDCLNEAQNAAKIMSKFRQSVRNPSWEISQYIYIHVITKKMISALQKRADNAVLDIKLEGLDELPKIVINENALEQIVFILTQNAIEASDGETRHSLLISGKYKNGKVTLTFTDDCGGMTDEDAKLIFEPFFTTKTDKQGMGLGLEIIHRILLTCGGKIELKNQPGVGAKFAITLPVESNDTQD